MSKWSWLDLAAIVPSVLFLALAAAFLSNSGGERYPVSFLYILTGVAFLLSYAEGYRTFWHWLKLLLVSALWLPAMASYGLLRLLALLPWEEARILVGHRKERVWWRGLAYVPRRRAR